MEIVNKHAYRRQNKTLDQTLKKRKSYYMLMKQPIQQEGMIVRIYGFNARISIYKADTVSP